MQYQQGTDNDVFEGVEGYLLKKLLNDTVFRMNMREATELKEGRHGTAQMFLFMKHYLVGMYPTIVRSRIEICTTTSVPHINSGEYDIIPLPQFVDTPNPVMFHWSFHPDYHRYERKTGVHRQHFEVHKAE